MGEAPDPLAVEYGEPLPPGLAGLTADQRRFIADAIEAARLRQAEALAEATESGLPSSRSCCGGPSRSCCSVSARLETAAEVLKLERLLELDTGELDFLAELDAAEDLRTLREQATDRLFDAGAESLNRVAKRRAACSRRAGRDDRRARVRTAAVRAGRWRRRPSRRRSTSPAGCPPTSSPTSPIQLDPRRVARIIAGVPTELSCRASREILGGARGVRDDGPLPRLRARLTRSPPRWACCPTRRCCAPRSCSSTRTALDHAIGLLPPERLPGVLALRRRRNDLWPEALDLLDHLSDERRGPIADVVAAEDEDSSTASSPPSHAAELWEVLLPVVSVMSEEGRLRIAARPAFHAPQILEEIVGSAARDGRLWPDLLPLVEALPESVRGQAADLIAGQPPDVVTGLIDAVQELGLWSQLLPVVRTMSDANRVGLATMPAFHDEAVITAIVMAAAEEECWVDLAPLLRVLPDAAMDVVQAVVAGLPQETLALMLEQAVRGADALRPLVDVLADLDDVGRGRIVDVLDAAGPTLTAAAVRLREDPQFVDLVDQVPDDVMAAVDRAAARVGTG